MPQQKLDLPLGGTQQQRIDEIQEIGNTLVGGESAADWVIKSGAHRSSGAVQSEDWQRSAVEEQVKQIRGGGAQ